MTKISLIAAMANDRVIGKDNDMPWHMPADLQHFKKVTMGKPVVMGRRTFDSIGRPLPGRENVVITRNADWQHDGVSVVSTPQAALDHLAKYEEVMIIGGGKIYNHFLSQADCLYLTFIECVVEGDTQFPDWQNVGNWHHESVEKHRADVKNCHDYSFNKFSRIR
jgi:dihydrofolate reductase